MLEIGSISKLSDRSASARIVTHLVEAGLSVQQSEKIEEELHEALSAEAPPTQQEAS
jgi:hypothetical protein